MQLRGSLEKFKISALQLNKNGDDLYAFREIIGPKFLGEVVRLIEIGNELYEVANQLQWEIAEHDANYSERLEGSLLPTRLSWMP